MAYKVKEIKATELAFTYVGCFLGAGFLSGNELWQFFGSFGKAGAIAIIISIIIQGVIGFIVVKYVSDNGVREFDVLIVKKKVKSLRGFFVASEMIFILFTVSVMLAGAGSLFKTVLNMNGHISSLIFTIAVMVVAYFGLSGVISVFNATVPILTVATVTISVIVLSKCGFFNLNIAPSVNKPKMLPNWILSAIVFAAHNVYCTLGIITPLGERVKDVNIAVQGITLACVILLIVSVAVLIPLYANVEYAEKELPMLELAKFISEPFFYVYAFLMFAAMFGTAVSYTVSVTDYCERKFNKIKYNKIFLIIALGVLTYTVSLFGFNSLIAVIYPLSGYVGIVAIIMIIINYFFLK